ncbi:hypothetical protein GW17_00037508 [Ensete ventricosum]|nr:hypothetical protein GW17_00037508 [Ensete ventricosum]
MVLWTSSILWFIRRSCSLRESMDSEESVSRSSTRCRCRASSCIAQRGMVKLRWEPRQIVDKLGHWRLSFCPKSLNRCQYHLGVREGTVGGCLHRGRVCRMWLLPCCREIFSDPQDLMEIA